MIEKTIDGIARNVTTSTERSSTNQANKEQADFFSDWKSNHQDRAKNHSQHLDQLVNKLKAWKFTKSAEDYQIANNIFANLFKRVKNDDLATPESQAEFQVCLYLISLWFKDPTQIKSIEAKLQTNPELTKVIIRNLDPKIQLDSLAPLLVILSNIDTSNSNYKQIAVDILRNSTGQNKENLENTITRLDKSPFTKFPKQEAMNGWETGENPGPRDRALKNVRPEYEADQSWFPGRRSLLIKELDIALNDLPLANDERQRMIDQLIPASENMFQAAYQMYKSKSGELSYEDRMRIEAQLALIWHEAILHLIIDMRISHRLNNELVMTAIMELARDAVQQKDFLLTLAQKKSKNRTSATASQTTEPVVTAGGGKITWGNDPKSSTPSKRITVFGKGAGPDIDVKITPQDYANATAQLITFTRAILSEQPQLQQKLDTRRMVQFVPDGFNLAVSQTRVDNRESCVLACVQMLMNFVGQLDRNKVADLIHHKHQMLHEAVKASASLLAPASSHGTVSLMDIEGMNQWFTLLATASKNEGLTAEKTKGKIRVWSAQDNADFDAHLNPNHLVHLQETSKIFNQKMVAYIIASFAQAKGEIFSVTLKDPNKTMWQARTDLNHQVIINSMTVEQTDNGADVFFNIFDPMGGARIISVWDFLRSTTTVLFIATQEQPTKNSKLQFKREQAPQPVEARPEQTLVMKLANKSREELRKHTGEILAEIATILTTFKQAQAKESSPATKEKAIADVKNLFIFYFLSLDETTITNLNYTELQAKTGTYLATLKENSKDMQARGQLRLVLSDFFAAVIRNARSKNELQSLDFVTQKSRLAALPVLSTYFVNTFDDLVQSMVD